MISLQKIITKLKSMIDKNTADITALNSGLLNITGKASPFGIFTKQSIDYIKIGKLVIISGYVDAGTVQPSEGYPAGAHYTVATIPYTPYANYAALSGFCTNSTTSADVLVEPGKITFKMTSSNPYPDVIYISGAFIMA